MRITAPIHDTFLKSAATESNEQPLSELVSEVVGGRMAGRLSRNQRAAHAWFSVNGDVERKHTCGVYLKKPARSETGPVLGVYVDSSARVTDFRANKELYLARLANAGFAVSDIDFRLSRTPKPAQAAAARAKDGNGTAKGAPAMPPLTPAEEDEVTTMVADLPSGLSEAAARAMRSSLRREKQHKNGI